MGLCMLRDTDYDWELLGQKDPYWAVLSAEEHKSLNDSDVHTKELLDKFYQTGEDYVAYLFGKIQRLFVSPFVPTHILDFGSGV